MTSDIITLIILSIISAIISFIIAVKEDEQLEKAVKEKAKILVKNIKIVAVFFKNLIFKSLKKFTTKRVQEFKKKYKSREEYRKIKDYLLIKYLKF